jgi:hypothetical protein
VVVPRLRPLRYPWNYPQDPPIENGIDVNLALGAVEWTLRKRCDVASIFSHDTDLLPVPETIARLAVRSRRDSLMAKPDLQLSTPATTRRLPPQHLRGSVPARRNRRELRPRGHIVSRPRAGLSADWPGSRSRLPQGCVTSARRCTCRRRTALRPGSLAAGPASTDPTPLNPRASDCPRESQRTNTITTIAMAAKRVAMAIARVSIGSTLNEPHDACVRARSRTRRGYRGVAARSRGASARSPPDPGLPRGASRSRARGQPPGAAETPHDPC